MTTRLTVLDSSGFVPGQAIEIVPTPADLKALGLEVWWRRWWRGRWWPVPIVRRARKPVVLTVVRVTNQTTIEIK